MLVQMYLEKTRGAYTFGTIVQDAGTILKALPIPASPYLTAANAFINFANTSIQDDAKNSGAMLFAQVLLQFADQDYPDVQTCKNKGGDSTGAIAVVAATGRTDVNLLNIGEPRPEVLLAVHNRKRVRDSVRYQARSRMLEHCRVPVE